MVQKFNSPDGKDIELDWATEETLGKVLEVLEKKYGKAGSAKTKQDKADEKTRKSASKSFKFVAEQTEKYSKKIKESKEELSGFVRKSESAAEALDLISDGSHVAGKWVKKLGTTSASAVDEIEKMDGSAKGATSAFFKIVGAAGAVGTAFGIAAGMLDQMVEFQTNAIQTGFSFSSELINTRGNVAGLGMNMKQLGDIISSNGEAIRSLGGSGVSATNAFIDLVKDVKETSKEFGLFGMTTEEIAGLTAERLDLLRKQGFTGVVAADAVTDSFAELNHQVMALSKLTGRDRREIMRNNLATREGASLLIHDLAKLGPNATASFDSVMTSMSAIFGEQGSTFTDVFSKTLESHFMGGMERLSGDQLAAMSQVDGLRELFETARDQFLANADDPAAMRDINEKFGQSVSELLAASADDITKLARYQEDSAVGEFLREMVAAGQSATNFMLKTEEEKRMAYETAMNDDEKDMLQMRDRMNILQNSFQAQLLRLFGIEDLASVLDDDTVANAETIMTEFGDVLVGIRDGLFSLFELFDNGTWIDELAVAGLALFAANGVLSLAMASGAKLAFARIVAPAAVATATAATTAVTSGALGATTGTMLTGGAALAPLAIGAGTVAILAAATSRYKDLMEQYPEMAAMNNGAGPGLTNASYWSQHPEIMAGAIEEDKRKNGEWRATPENPFRFPNTSGTTDIMQLPETGAISMRDVVSSPGVMTEGTASAPSILELTTMIAAIEEQNRLAAEANNIAIKNGRNAVNAADAAN